MNSATDADPKLAYLFEQFRACEVRRNYFGQLFWNTPKNAQDEIEAGIAKLEKQIAVGVLVALGRRFNCAGALE